MSKTSIKNLRLDASSSATASVVPPKHGIAASAPISSSAAISSTAVAATKTSVGEGGSAAIVKCATPSSTALVTISASTIGSAKIGPMRPFLMKPTTTVPSTTVRLQSTGCRGMPGAKIAGPSTAAVAASRDTLGPKRTSAPVGGVFARYAPLVANENAAKKYCSPNGAVHPPPARAALTTAVPPSTNPKSNPRKRARSAGTNPPAAAQHLPPRCAGLPFPLAPSVARFPDDPAAATARQEQFSQSALYPHREGLSEKKIRRLEKNRVSARDCRRRKKEAAINLEQEINILESENLRLRLQLQIGEEAAESTLAEQNKLTENLDELLKSGASETEIHNSVDKFKEKFADYGRDRRSSVEFHLRNVERLLMPTTTTSVAMRALHGGVPSFSSPATTGNGTVGSVKGRNDCSGKGPNSEVKGPGVDRPAIHDSEGNDIPKNKIGPLDQELARVRDAGSWATERGKTSLAVPSPSKLDAPFSSDSTVWKKALVTTSAQSGEEQESTIVSINPEDETIPTFVAASSAAAAAMAPVPSKAFASRPSRASMEPKKLFQYLVNYLEVTLDQAIALKDSRLVAKELDDALKESLAMLQELRSTVTKCSDDLNAEFNSVRQILSPTQAAKFLVWVSNNEACMHMLNELWSKVYPNEGTGGSDEE